MVLLLGGLFLLCIQIVLYAKRFVCRFVCKKLKRKCFIFLYLYSFYYTAYKTYKRNRYIKIERNTTFVCEVKVLGVLGRFWYLNKNINTSY